MFMIAFSNLSYVINSRHSVFLEMSNAERLLSYSLLSLITSKPLASSHALTEEDGDEGAAKEIVRKGLMNGDGAWCWREDCTG